MSIQTSAIFDTFRYGSSATSGPVLFDGLNRTPAIEDVRNILIYVSFLTLFIAFILIFPGIRKERISTFICVTVSLLVGAVILIANFGTHWHVASAAISSPYRAFSREKITARIGVNVGLLSVNVTLSAASASNHHDHRHHHQRPTDYDVNYNERLYWIDPQDMKLELKKGLAKGLPFPILTVAEYLSQDSEGFCWGRRYRLAGYYSSIILWGAFASWLLMNVLLCAVPRYGVYCMQLTGLLMLGTNALYAILLPRKPLEIPFEDDLLQFRYGWSFWSVLVAGSVAVVVGAILSIVDSLFPNKFSTILEIDYDTPYRYFVGNDAHLFGHHSNCPHAQASPTSSTATESTTCCGGRCDDHELVKKKLRKMKSNASTSTDMSIPVKRGQDFSGGPLMPASTLDTISQLVTTTTTIAKIESRRGLDNDAFQDDDDDHHPSSKTSAMSSPSRQASNEDNNQQDEDIIDIISERQDGDDQSDDSDISTTIIDGKRAISLHNFGRYQVQQQSKVRQPSTNSSSGSSSTSNNNNNPSSSSSHPSSSPKSDVTFAPG